MKKRSGLSIAAIALALVAITASPVLADGVAPIYFHAGHTLDNTLPTATTPQQADSGPLTFAGGNGYQLVGYWIHSPNLGVDGDLHFWLGLKNSDDQGTNFDIAAVILDGGSARRTVYKTCVTGLTRNPALAKEVVIPVGYVGSTGGPTQVDVYARIGTTDAATYPSPSKCAGHSSATGLRLYYDSTTRPSGIWESDGV